jgi:hypothetical protein
MITRDDVNQLLAAFCQSNALEVITLDETNLASVTFGEEGELSFEYNETNGELMLWSPLCSLDIAENAAEERALLRHVLTLGFPSAGLFGAHVAMDESGILMLARNATIRPSQADEFVGLCSTFASQVLKVIEDLKSREWLEPQDMSVNLTPQSERDVPTGGLRI